MRVKKILRRTGQKSIRVMLFFCVLLTGTTGFADSSLQKIQRTETMMDTFFTITVYSGSPQAAEKAMGLAFDRIKKIESELDIYRDESQISVLNREKTIEYPSEDFQKNIARALYFSTLSGGAFDITVQPILDLYSRAFSENNAAPSGKMIDTELKKVSYKRVVMGDGRISIGNDQSITLGGIAKGYAVEEAVEILRRHHIDMALVDASGNMRALGGHPDGVWHVAMADPRDMSSFITIIPLDNNAVSTSGDYERYFDDTMNYHHIINPKTGYSATELISATIITDNAFDADVLSTAVFVLGKEAGMRLIESLPGVEGFIITKEREIFRSSGFHEITYDTDSK